jgi:hypothetical protein
MRPRSLACCWLGPPLPTRGCGSVGPKELRPPSRDAADRNLLLTLASSLLTQSCLEQMTDATQQAHCHDHGPVKASSACSWPPGSLHPMIQELSVQSCLACRGWGVGMASTLHSLCLWLL